MNAKDFCYWLQGHFELGGDHARFGPDPLAKVKAHLALVRRVEPKHDNLFVAWLEMKLRNVTMLDTASVDEIRRLLGAQFKHEIDPSYPGDFKVLQAIHDPDLWSSGPTLHGGGHGPDTAYRC